MWTTTNHWRFWLCNRFRSRTNLQRSSGALRIFFENPVLGTKNYSAFDRELLAIHDPVKHFRSLLDGRKFLVLTDHKPLLHLTTLNNPSPKQLRQTTFLSEFDFFYFSSFRQRQCSCRFLVPSRNLSNFQSKYFFRFSVGFSSPFCEGHFFI